MVQWLYYTYVYVINDSMDYNIEAAKSVITKIVLYLSLFS